KLETNSEKLKNKMKKLEAGDKRKEELEYEIKRIKFQILNMRKVLEHVNIISVGEKYSSDVIELAKILGLSKVPERIEGYDISNIFCKEAVGSMVVFKGGEPDKEEYRKFKIKFKNESGDVGMLSEVLERRFKHARYNQKIVAAKHKSKSINQNFFWPDPDLIIVDGGKAQLNVVLKILKKQKLDIPALAVSKRQGLRSARALDKVFFPGQSKPLELPLASPALHIIKRVRDEAHRFAISYHRKLRSKKISSL
ncbi:MAG: hypothetical protein U9R06_01665, partial [Patescibacteria group bacterium]|nr:hypothetical protein [Patescibacteria group bacterium]